MSEVVERIAGTGRVLFLCDHATNIVPNWVAQGDLGLPNADMARHIAWDIGAAGLTRAMAGALGAPALLSRFSRLVIDPNRGSDDPTQVMKLYDGTLIPANADASEEDIAARRTRLYAPYHAAIDAEIAQLGDPILISIHSFTKQLKDRAPRPWEVGILSAQDRRLADAFLAQLAQSDMVVGDNVPYDGALRGDCMDQHGLQKGLAHVLIEIRNDLIETEAQQIEMAGQLIPHLTAAIDAMDKETQYG